ncbi:MAG: hypothetical protein ACYCO0_04810 [Candidatus Micrarchaeaceae archaeon]
MRRRKRKSAWHPDATTIIILILIVAIVFAVIRSNNLNTLPASQIGSINQSIAYNIPSLNITDIAAATHNSSYIPIYTDRITPFSPVLRNLGYLASSSSIFNFTGTLNNLSTFPKTIGVIVFLMNNSSSAAESVNSMLFSNNANQSIRGYVLNSTNISNYSSSGGSIHIYTISSIAVFNATDISPTNAILLMPDYQYTSIFSFNNAVGTVVINGYTNHLNGTISRRIAETLAAKMASENCCKKT